MKTRYDVHSLSILGGYILFISLVIVIISIVSCKKEDGVPIQEQLVHSAIKEGGESLQDNSIQQNNVLSYMATLALQHYWNSFSIIESTPDNISHQIQTAVDNFISIIPYANDKTVCSAITKSLEKAEVHKDALSQLLELYEMYFYNPISPFRNDEHYIVVLRYILDSNSTTEGAKSRADFRLKMALKNRINTPAANITYTLESGKTGTLYDISGKYTMLMFYNPDCHSCEETIAYIEESPILSKSIERREVAVLALYPDSDLSIWVQNKNKIPKAWTNGYDKKGIVKSELLYDLKAIPSLYLLDENKHVLLKDADLEAIEVYLRNELIDR